MPGFAGAAKGANQIELQQKYQGHGGEPFDRVPLQNYRSNNGDNMSFQIPPTASGWLISTMAYHPDWTVTIDGHPSQIKRAEAALLSTFVPLGSHEVVFQFKAPGWYNPVSYTHLDVYKRQVYAWQLNPEQKKEAQFRNLPPIHFKGAVSYTHLDVYKRQPEWNAAGAPWGEAFLRGLLSCLWRC